jgi:hypothetical protein
MDVSLQVLGESSRCEVGVGAHLLIVRHTEGNDVVVWGQNAAAKDFTRTGIGFPAQHRLDLLRHNRTAENAGECVSDGRLEFAFDAVDQTHITARLARRYPLVLLTRRCASVSPGHVTYLHGIGPAHRCGTNRILRIESKQVRRLDPEPFTTY